MLPVTTPLPFPTVTQTLIHGLKKLHPYWDFEYNEIYIRASIPQSSSLAQKRLYVQIIAQATKQVGEDELNMVNDMLLQSVQKQIAFERELQPVLH